MALALAMDVLVGARRRIAGMAQPPWPEDGNVDTGLDRHNLARQLQLQLHACPRALLMFLTVAESVVRQQ